MRLALCELIDEGILFLGQNTYKLESPYVFETAFLSLMERCEAMFRSNDFVDLCHSDPTDELLMIIGIFSHFFALETTLAERQFFRALAKLIGRRAARLSACGIAAIVSRMGYFDEECSVGADGSLYNVSYRKGSLPSLIVFLGSEIPGIRGQNTRRTRRHFWGERTVGRDVQKLETVCLLAAFPGISLLIMPKMVVA